MCSGVSWREDEIIHPNLSDSRTADQTEAASPLIRCRGLSKSFQGSRSRIDILRDLDFDLGKGETVAIVGASGIGKSTFLQILGTLDRPDEGTLFFGDTDIFRLDADRLARFRNRSMGFVFQFHHLLAEFTALENVMMPLLIAGERKSVARERASELLARVGLGERLDHRVPKLSGGEQQRVALARALVHRPPLVLADEPTGNLDRKNSEAVHRLLDELNREMEMALVVVTHSDDLAAYMGRRLTLSDGKLVEMG